VSTANTDNAVVKGHASRPCDNRFSRNQAVDRYKKAAIKFMSLTANRPGLSEKVSFVITGG